MKNVWNHHLAKFRFRYVSLSHAMDHEIKPFERYIFPIELVRLAIGWVGSGKKR